MGLLVSLGVMWKESSSKTGRLDVAYITYVRPLLDRSGKERSKNECMRQMTPKSLRTLPCIGIIHILLSILKAGETEADLLFMTYIQRWFHYGMSVCRLSQHLTHLPWFCESSSQCLKLDFWYSKHPSCAAQAFALALMSYGG